MQKRFVACHPMLLSLLCAMLSMSAASMSAQAQGQLPAVKGQPTPAAAVPMPDNAKMTLLIQLHMAALSLANMTGNYSVLHALGTPTFQAANSPAQLAANFSGFRAQSIDISPTMLYAPILAEQPRMDGAGSIRIVGQYNTQPQRVVFEMAFQPSNNTWRLAGISVRTVAADSAAPVAETGSIQSRDDAAAKGAKAKAAAPTKK
jgi:hypothetical protein